MFPWRHISILLVLLLLNSCDNGKKNDKEDILNNQIQLNTEADKQPPSGKNTSIAKWDEFNWDEAVWDE